jgi:hypothetical protein
MSKSQKSKKTFENIKGRGVGRNLVSKIVPNCGETPNGDFIPVKGSELYNNIMKECLNCDERIYRNVCFALYEMSLNNPIVTSYDNRKRLLEYNGNPIDGKYRLLTIK